jgi:hypothetical protein
MAEATKTLAHIPPLPSALKLFAFRLKSEHSPMTKLDSTRPTQL